MPKKLKTLTDPKTDFRKPTTTDEKAYPTMEAVPKFRQSARWECCWPEVARSRHRHPGPPVPIVAVDFSQRSEPNCRPADLPTCRIWVLDFSDSSEVSPAFKSKAGNFTASFSSRPRLPSQGPAIVRTSSSVFRARCNLPKFSLSRWKQRGTKK
jgi:hypothetical protein